MDLGNGNGRGRHRRRQRDRPGARRRVRRRRCSVVLADVETDALRAAEQRIAATGVDTLAVLTDVSKREQVEALAAQTIERFGHVNVLCNNAGVAGGGDPWFGGDRVVGVGDRRQLLGRRPRRADVPPPPRSRRASAHIVNTASIAGLYPGFSPPYDASKHAVVALTEGLYNTMTTAGLPVGVSCLCPGWVRTRIVDATRNWPSDSAPPRRPMPPARSVMQARAPGDRRGHAAGGGRRSGGQRRAREPVLGVPPPRVPRRSPSSASTASPTARPGAEQRADAGHAARDADHRRGRSPHCPDGGVSDVIIELSAHHRPEAARAGAARPAARRSCHGDPKEMHYDDFVQDGPDWDHVWVDIAMLRAERVWPRSTTPVSANSSTAMIAYATKKGWLDELGTRVQRPHRALTVAHAPETRRRRRRPTAPAGRRGGRRAPVEPAGISPRADHADQPGHRLALVDRVGEHALRARGELDRLDRLLVGDAVGRAFVAGDERDLVGAQIAVDADRARPCRWRCA